MVRAFHILQARGVAAVVTSPEAMSEFIPQLNWKRLILFVVGVRAFGDAGRSAAAEFAPGAASPTQARR